MTDRGRRFGKGVAIALAVHIIAAALLGVLGYRFTQRPPQILEVTLGGGGGGGGVILVVCERNLSSGTASVGGGAGGSYGGSGGAGWYRVIELGVN